MSQQENNKETGGPLTITGLRDQLRQRQAAAKDAGLVGVLGKVDLRLMMTVRECIAILDAALAAKAAPASDLLTAHAAIVESLDAAPAPTPRTPVAPLKKPPLALGAAPAVPTRMPAPRKMPPKAARVPTGPDAWDDMIPL